MGLGTDTEGLVDFNLYNGVLPGPAAPTKKPVLAVGPNTPGPTTATVAPGFNGPVPVATDRVVNIPVGPNRPGPTTDTPFDQLPPGFSGPLPEGPMTKVNRVLEGLLNQFLGQPKQRSVPSVSGGANGTSFLSSITSSFSRVPTAPGSKLGFRRNRSDENDRIKTSTRGVTDNASVRRNAAGGRKNKAKGTP